MEKMTWSRAAYKKRDINDLLNHSGLPVTMAQLSAGRYDRAGFSGLAESGIDVDGYAPPQGVGLTNNRRSIGDPHRCYGSADARHSAPFVGKDGAVFDELVLAASPEDIFIAAEEQELERQVFVVSGRKDRGSFLAPIEDPLYDRSVPLLSMEEEKNARRKTRENGAGPTPPPARRRNGR